MARISWTIGKKIGDPGGYGEVFESIRKIDGIDQPGKYALKKLIRTDSESIARFQKEVRLLKTLSHPRIVKIEGFQLKTVPYIYIGPSFK